MKPARREAYFSCLQTIVEHSANSIELLCKSVFGLSGRYTKIDLKIPSETLSYTNLSATNAVKAWFASASMPNGVCLRLINHSTGIILAIAYKVSDYYGAIVYFGYGIDGIQLIRHINGAWS